MGRLNDLEGRAVASMEYVNETHCAAHSIVHVSKLKIIFFSLRLRPRPVELYAINFQGQLL